MVRVKKRSFRYDESDDDDSDSDYTPEIDTNPKKYSLRKRTKQTLVEDFDYEVDSDVSQTRQPTDDEDFEVEGENGAGPYIEYVQPVINEQGSSGNQQTDDNNGLIDFEDMIRADIVINKNRIDYDHVIGRSEIKVDKKRGRPPKKKQVEEEFTHSILGPLVDALVSPYETIPNTEENLAFHLQATSASSKAVPLDILEPVTEMIEPLEKSHPGNLENESLFTSHVEDETDQPEVIPQVNNKDLNQNSNGIINDHKATSLDTETDFVKSSCSNEHKKSGPDKLLGVTIVDTQLVDDTDADVVIIEKSESDKFSPVKVDVKSQSVDAIEDDVVIIEDTPDVIILDD